MNEPKAKKPVLYAYAIIVVSWITSLCFIFFQPSLGASFNSILPTTAIPIIGYFFWLIFLSEILGHKLTKTKKEAKAATLKIRDIIIVTSSFYFAVTIPLKIFLMYSSFNPLLAFLVQITACITGILSLKALINQLTEKYKITPKNTNSWVFGFSFLILLVFNFTQKLFFSSLSIQTQWELILGPITY